MKKLALALALAGLSFAAKGQALTNATVWKAIAGDVQWLTDVAALKTFLFGASYSGNWTGSTSLTTLGTISTGTWSGTAIGPTKGGTGLTTYTTGDLIIATAPNTLSKLAIGTSGQVLTVSSGVPAWAAAGGGGGGGSPSVISPSQITSAWAHNWAPTGIGDATTIRVDFDNSLPGITGIDVTDISDGERKRIINDGAYFGFILPDNASSTAANRFTGTGVEFLPPYGGSAEIEYDGTASRWRVLSNNFVPSIYPGIAYNQVSSGSSTAGDIADLTITTSGTGAAATTSAASSASTTYRSLSTGTTATGAIAIAAFKGPPVTSYAVARAAHVIASGQIRVPTLSDATNRFVLEIGLASTSGVTETSTGCFLRYSDNINSGKWQAVSENSSTETTGDTGVTVATDGIYRYTISLDSGGYEANFWLNGVHVANLNTNTPGSGTELAHRQLIRKTAGTTARTLGSINMISYAVYSGQ